MEIQHGGSLTAALTADRHPRCHRRPLRVRKRRTGLSQTLPEGIVVFSCSDPTLPISFSRPFVFRHTSSSAKIPRPGRVPWPLARGAWAGGKKNRAGAPGDAGRAPPRSQKEAPPPCSAARCAMHDASRKPGRPFAAGDGLTCHRSLSCSAPTRRKRACGRRMFRMARRAALAVVGDVIVMTS